MVNITIRLPEDVAAELEAGRVSEEQLDAFLAAAVKAWLARRQATQREGAEAEKPPWSEAFQDSAVAFVDQLIDENRALFEELARL
jgi:hypothetical protein